MGYDWYESWGDLVWILGDLYVSLLVIVLNVMILFDSTPTMMVNFN